MLRLGNMGEGREGAEMKGEGEEIRKDEETREKEGMGRGIEEEGGSEGKEMEGSSKGMAGKGKEAEEGGRWGKGKAYS